MQLILEIRNGFQNIKLEEYKLTKREDKSRKAEFNPKTGVIRKEWRINEIFSRKDYLDMREKCKSDIERLTEQVKSIQQQKETMEEHLKKAELSLVAIIEVTNSFEDNYIKQCKDDVNKVMGEHKFSEILASFNSSWTEESDDWKTFENTRTKELYAINIDKTLISKYPSSMLKDVIWGIDFNPMELQKKNDKIVKEE